MWIVRFSFMSVSCVKFTLTDHDFKCTKVGENHKVSHFARFWFLLEAQCLFLYICIFVSQFM